MTLEAERQAHSLFLEAKSAGYAAGMFAAAESFAHYLSASAESTRKARQQLFNYI